MQRPLDGTGSERAIASRLRALIVDGNALDRQSLRAEIAELDGLDVVEEANDLDEARRKIVDIRPDLVFLAFDEATGVGSDAFTGLDEADPYVIVLTKQPELALPAFDIEAGDCIIKPVQQPRLLRSLQRARQRIAERRVAALAMQMMSALGTLGSSGEDQTSDGLSGELGRSAAYRSYLRFRVRRRLYSLETDDILWVQGASQYCRLHTRRGEFVLARTLASLECQLDPKKFFRIHRSAIVNAAHVREVRSTGDGRYNIYLYGGQALPMGRARREILERLLNGIASKGK